MYEQRLTVRLTQYWQRIRKDAPMPDYKKHNSGAIEDLWPFCFVVSVVPAHKNVYKYDYVGEKIVEAYGKDPSGTTVDLRAERFPNSVISRNLPIVADLEAPKELDGNILTDAGKILKYRSVLLPFGSEKAGLTHVLVGLSYRTFS
jgi:hypothetical protein